MSNTIRGGNVIPEPILRKPASAVNNNIVLFDANRNVIDSGEKPTTLTPTGIIFSFGGVSAPTGFLLCDGSNLLRTTYAALFAVIGTAFGTADGTHFNVPDFRGLSLRGRANGSSNDPDRATRTVSGSGGATGDNVGSYQADALQGHWHNLYYGGNGNVVSGGGNTWWANNTSSPNYNHTAGPLSKAVKQSISDGVNGTPRIKSESRPKNVYVNYIIKY